MGIRSDERETVVSAVLAEALEPESASGRWLCALEDGQVAAEITALGGTATRWARWADPGAEPAPWPPAGPFDRASLRLPHGRDSQLMWLEVIASRLTEHGELWVHGANDEGIKSVAGRMEPLFERVEVISTRRHCRVLRGVTPTGEPRGALDAHLVEVSAQVSDRTLSWTSLPGLFAHGRLDDATRMLLETLPALEGPVLDFGCGAGVIARYLHERDGAEVHLSDIDTLALEVAGRNVPGAPRYAADGLPSSGVRFTAIVTNPPLHRGKATDPGPLRRLVSLAPAHLRKGGTLWLVTQGAQRLREALSERFTDVRIATSDHRFKVWQATV